MFFAKFIGKNLRWNLLLINLKSTGLQLYQKRGSSAVIFLRILRNSLEPLFHGKRSSDCFCYAKFNLGHWSTSLVPMLHFIQKAADVKYGKTLKLKKNWHEIGQHLTAWKVSECRVFSGPYFPIIQNEYRALLVFGHFLKNIYKKESFYWKRFIYKIIYILGWSILMVITCIMMINLLRPGVH